MKVQWQVRLSLSCRYRQFRPAQKYAFHSSVALGLLIKGAVVKVAFTQHLGHWRALACRSSQLAMACIGWFVVGATRSKRLFHRSQSERGPPKKGRPSIFFCARVEICFMPSMEILTICAGMLVLVLVLCNRETRSAFPWFESYQATSASL